MPSDDLDFAIDLTGVDTRAILDDALWRTDALEGHLAADRSAETEHGPAGTLLRSMDEDVAQFAAFPVVYRITEQDFAARDGAVPQGFRQLSAGNRFYRIEFPLNLFPRSSWSFDRLEVRLEFNRGDSPSARPKAFQILPNKQLEALASWKYGVTVQLDANLRLAIEPPSAAAALPLPVEAGAKASAHTGLGLAIGPFEYHLKRMVVQTSAPGLEQVFWRLEDAKLLQEDPVSFVVITQVPAAAPAVRVDCALQAYRNYNFLADRVRNTFRELPRAIRTYFQNGAPVRAETSYDLTAECAA
jgi:hypothetical protein